MRRLSFWILGCTSFIVSVIVTPILAQAPLGEAASVLPRVYVKDLKITSESSHRLRGTFNLLNTEQFTVGDIKYEIIILNPAPAPAPVPGPLISDNAAIIDRAVQTDNVVLSAQEEKNISFTYEPPPLPEGQYRVRIQARLSNDRELGWDTTQVTVSDAGRPFIFMEAKKVITDSVDPVTGQLRREWRPREGVNIEPGQPLELEALVKNANLQEIAATAAVTTRRILVNTSTVETVKGPTITIPAEQEQTLSLPLPALTQPGAYSIFLVLHDKNNQRISSMAEYRYVVRGVSGSIVSAYVSQLTESKAKVTYTIVGPADRQTILPGRVMAAIHDGGIEIGSATKAIELNPGGKTEHLEINLPRYPIQPTLRLRLATTDEQVLHEYTVALSSSAPAALQALTASAHAAPGSFNRFIWVGLGALVLGSLMLGGIALYRALRPRRLPPAMIPLLFFAGSSLAGVWVGNTLEMPWAVPAQASGFQVYQDQETDYGAFAFTVFVNRPIHGSTQTSYAVPYEMTLRWMACENAMYDFSVNLYSGDGHSAANVLAPFPAGFPYHHGTFNSQVIEKTADPSGSTIDFVLDDGPYAATIVFPPSSNNNRTLLSLIDARKTHAEFEPEPCIPTSTVPSPRASRRPLTGRPISQSIVPIAPTILPGPTLLPGGVTILPGTPNPAPNATCNPSPGTSTSSNPAASRKLFGDFTWLNFAISPQPSAPAITSAGCTPSIQSILPGGTADMNPLFNTFMYSWSAPGGRPSRGFTTRSSPTFSVDFASQGTYQVSVGARFGSAQGMCVVNVIDFANPLTCQAPSGPIYAGDPVTFTASGGDDVSYVWLAPGSTPASLGGPNLTSFSTTFLQGGTHDVTVRNGNQITSCTITILANPNPSPSASPSPFPAPSPSSSVPSPAPGPAPAPSPTFDIGGYRYID